MTTLTHRERVLKALNHEETDRVPIDMGGTPATSVHPVPYIGLLRHLGLNEEAEKVEAASTVHKGGFSGLSPSEEVLQRLDVDVRGIPLGAAKGKPNVFLNDNSYKDDWDVIWERVRGGPFITRLGPFQAKEPTVADLDRHVWPDPKDPGYVRGIRERAETLRSETDCAISLNLPYSVLRECQRIRGFGEFLADLLANPALAQAMLEHVLEVTSGIAIAALEEVGDLIDVAFFPEDMGTQNQLFMRPELYRKMLKPYHQRFVEAIKSKTHAKVLIHSDGAIFDIIGDFIEIGIDALNPIQISAKGMGDTKRLKAEFGKDLCFWGGIDTHRVLPFGTPEDVAAEVRQRIDDLSQGGGYVLASVHTINAEVPAGNVAAMLDTAKSYRPGSE